MQTLTSTLFYCSVLMDKHVEHQSFEVVSAIIQKKFAKHEYLSGTQHLNQIRVPLISFEFSI